MEATMNSVKQKAFLALRREERWLPGYVTADHFVGLLHKRKSLYIQETGTHSQNRTGNLRSWHTHNFQKFCDNNGFRKIPTIPLAEYFQSCVFQPQHTNQLRMLVGLAQPHRDVQSLKEGSEIEMKVLSAIGQGFGFQNFSSSKESAEFTLTLRPSRTPGLMGFPRCQ